MKHGLNYNVQSLYPSSLKDACEYLKELIDAREKYMVTDFGKYLKVCREIDDKFGIDISLYVDTDKN